MCSGGVGRLSLCLMFHEKARNLYTCFLREKSLFVYIDIGCTSTFLIGSPLMLPVSTSKTIPWGDMCKSKNFQPKSRCHRVTQQTESRQIREAERKAEREKRREQDNLHPADVDS